MPTPEQRKAQYDWLRTNLPIMEDIAIKWDAAVAALSAQQSIVKVMQDRLNVLRSKTQPYGGATAAERSEEGQLSDQFLTEYTKLSGFDALSRDLKAQFNGLWTPGNVAYHRLLDDPGASENMTGTP